MTIFNKLAWFIVMLTGIFGWGMIVFFGWVPDPHTTAGVAFLSLFWVGAARYFQVGK